MIRMTGIVFSRTQGGPQQRTLRPTTTGPYATKRSDVVGGLSFLSEDMHNTLLATCEALLTEENDIGVTCEPGVYAPTANWGACESCSWHIGVWIPKTAALFQRFQTPMPL